MFRISCSNIFDVQHGQGAHAQTWVGSTGTVDPNSTNLVKYINGRIELRNDAPVGSVAFIRYNVLPVRDLAADLQSISYRI